MADDQNGNMPSITSDNPNMPKITEPTAADTSGEANDNVNPNPTPPKDDVNWAEKKMLSGETLVHDSEGNDI